MHACIHPTLAGKFSGAGLYIVHYQQRRQSLDFIGIKTTKLMDNHQAVFIPKGY